MASSPDLFVVCKNCGSEVSPYITECPYCGTRLRKRAPKIERDGTVSEPKPKKQKRARTSRVPRPRRERAGIGAALDTRPWATLTLVLLSLFGYLLLSVVARADVAVAGPVDGRWWKVVTSPFVYGSAWYELAAGPRAVKLAIVIAAGAAAYFASLAVMGFRLRDFHRRGAV